MPQQGLQLQKPWTMPRANNLIATDRPDRCHFVLSSNAVSVAEKNWWQHMVWETVKTCYPSPEQDASGLHLGGVQIWS